MPSQGPFQVKQRDSSRRLRGSWLHWETALKTKTEWGLRSWEAGRGLLADGSTVNTLLARRSQCWAIMCSLCSFEPLRPWSSVRGSGKLTPQRGESAGKPIREHLGPGPTGVPAALEPPSWTGLQLGDSRLRLLFLSLYVNAQVLLVFCLRWGKHRTGERALG